MSATRAEELIEEFDWYDGVYKREEVEEALALREEITPLLIRILEEVAEDPKRYEQDDHYANVYAAILLSHFQEPAAHEPILRAFRIPEKERDMLWGDMVGSNLPALLLQTCNGRLDSIRELILDREVADYVRAAAVDAITYAVARNMIGREEAIAFLSNLFTGAEAEPDSYFWSNVVCAISDLHPEESMPVIRKAFEDGLIEPGYVSIKDIEIDLARDREEILDQLRKSADRAIPSDVHDYISWFACFDETDSSNQVAEPSSPTPKTQQNKKKKNRAKGKLAKKSRKKNRR